MEVEEEFDEQFYMGEDDVDLQEEEVNEYDRDYNEDNEYVYETHSLELEEFDRLSKKHDTVCRALDDTICEYIVKADLTLYYSNVELEKKRKEIIEWLKEMFTEEDVLYHIDSSMLRQLLTNPTCGPALILGYCTRHAWITDNSAEWPKGRKRELRITCEELSLNATSLRKYLRIDPTIFGDIEEYRRLLKQHGLHASSPVVVDVCYVWFRDFIKSVSVLEKHNFHAVDEIIVNRRISGISARQLEQKNKVKAIADAVDKEVTSLLNKKLKSCIKKFITGMDHKRPFTPDDNNNTVPFLVERADMMTNRQGGTESTLKVMGAAIERLRTYANDRIRQCDVDEFYGDMTLEIQEVPIESFDRVRKSIWPPHVKLLMKRDVERRMLEDHRENEIDVSTLVVKFGDEEIARTIIPITTRPHWLINNHGVVIINNTINLNINNTSPTRLTSDASNDDAITTVLAPTNKRKRSTRESPFIERIKRIRLATEEEDDPTLVIYKLVITKLDFEPDLNQTRTCIVCDAKKPYSSFYHKKDYGKYVYHKEKNICHSCLATYAKWKKKSVK